MSIKIKDIPVTERPRERLIQYGSDALSNEELLAILLKTGTKNMSAKDLASFIISKTNNLKDIDKINYDYLKDVKGIGEAKATVIMAALELGKRMNQKMKTITGVKFTNSKIVYDYYKTILVYKKQEHFIAVYLDSNKRIIKEKLLFMGTLNQSLVHPREVFKEAYLVSASSFICVHNHPSGNILPSKADLDITKNLKEVSQLMGVPLVDHIIVGTDNYYSFYENGDI